MKVIRRPAVAFAGAACAAVVLASCSGTESGSANAIPSGDAADTSSTAASSAPQVPKVTNPADISELQDDPCAALAESQLDRLALEPGELDDTDAGSNCEWEYTEVVGNQVIIDIFDERSGLAGIYARKDSLAYFEDARISGYPVVYAGKYDDRDNGRCMLHVGLTDTFAPAVFAQLNGGSDAKRPCAVAEMTAQAMIENLESGS